MFNCCSAGRRAPRPSLLIPFFIFFRSFKTVPLASGDACQKKTTETLFFFAFFFFLLPFSLSHFFPFLLVSLVPFPLRAPVNGIFFVRVYFKVGRNAPAQLTRSWEFADNGYREGGFAKPGGAGAPLRGRAGTVTIMRWNLGRGDSFSAELNVMANYSKPNLYFNVDAKKKEGKKKRTPLILHYGIISIFYLGLIRGE